MSSDRTTKQFHKLKNEQVSGPNMLLIKQRKMNDFQENDEQIDRNEEMVFINNEK